jgi:uncharacterized protein
MDKKQKQIIQKTEEYVKETLKNAEKGHDYYHIERVRRIARKICKVENGDLFIVDLGAMLHDIADWKFTGGDDNVAPQKTKEFLESVNADSSTVEHVVNIVKNVSYSSSLKQEENKFSSKELSIVQDADRLDAMGAIGIARAFHYGGHKNRPLYDPEINPRKEISFEEYRATHQIPTVNHFYEKLFLLKDKMNTETGKKIAIHRHKFMEKYLEEFFKEWAGKK